MKGGIRRTSKYATNKAALRFFLQNSKFKIFSNDTVSCITIKVTLNSGVISPYKHTRANMFDVPVQEALIKVYPTATTESFLDLPWRSPHQGIEIATWNKVVAEAITQTEIFTRTLLDVNSTFLDPICPCLIYYEQNEKGSISNVINHSTLVPRTGRTVDQEIHEITATLGIGIENEVITTSYIMMEYMRGFDTPDNIIPHLSPDRSGFLYSLARYELDTLHRLGYYHGDFHQRNILLNPDYQYISTLPQYAGRFIIIDFGRSRAMTHEERQLPSQEQFIHEVNGIDDINGNFLQGHPGAIRAQYIGGYNFNVFRQQRISTVRQLHAWVLQTYRTPTIYEFIQRLNEYLAVPNNLGGGEKLKGGEYNNSIILKTNKMNVFGHKKDVFGHKKDVFDFGDLNEEFFKNYFNDKSPEEIKKLIQDNIDYTTKLSKHLEKSIETTSKTRTKKKTRGGSRRKKNKNTRNNR